MFYKRLKLNIMACKVKGHPYLAALWLHFGEPGQTLLLRVSQIRILFCAHDSQVKKSPCIGRVSYVVVFSPPVYMRRPT